MSKLKISLFLLCFGLVAGTQAQISGYPNVLSDELEQKPMWYIINVPITLPGAIGVTGQAQYIKPNSLYGSLDAGVGYVFNLTQALVEEKNRNFKPMGSLEIGYALQIATRSNDRRLLTSESVITSQGNSGTKIYKISVPHHVLFIPVAGLSYNPVSAKVGSKERYSTVLPALNLGIKLLGVNRTKTALKDSKSGEVYRNTTQQMGGIYAGASFALRNEIEVPNGFDSILKTEGPTFQFYGMMPGYLNSAGTFSFGIKSVPYEASGYQLFIGYHIYM